MAHVRLMTKLKNQSKFTHIAYLGGEKGGGLTSTGGIDVWDTLGLAWN
jgi:hypothetical protein